ncbi:MAG: GNAT family N-acetyltransferase [Candidatus Saganbacteria bacterium]|nr:GNAT family N-acetyltransferase [Candidatus Saganbacteria bacterium]
MLHEIIQLTEDNHPLWGELCQKSNDAWFWHTTEWMNYCISYGFEKHRSKNLSFIMIDDSGPIAICPLVLESHAGPDGKERQEFSISGSGGYLEMPAVRSNLTKGHTDKIMDEILETIDQMAVRHQVSRVSFRSAPLAQQRYNINSFEKFGYLDCSLSTHVIDLKLSLAEIWSDVRKGHKYDIHRGEKNFIIHIYDKDNADKSIFDQYRLLHHKASGRVTRPIETFEMMYDWIVRGLGMLCGVCRNGQYAGFSYISLYKDSAYYTSASDDPDFQTDVPISHVIQWSVIKWLKEKGFQTYEIGGQHYGPHIYDLPSAKDGSIAFFKRGFGGKQLPLYRVEKYFDRDYMRLSYELKIKALQEKASKEMIKEGATPG